MDQSEKTVAALQQEVTQLKHKLRVRAQLVSSLQQKSNSKGGADIKQLFEQLEEVSMEAAELRRQNTDLANENAILGKAINKLRDQQAEFSSKELQDALLDVNDELERSKQALAVLQSSKAESDRQVQALAAQLQETQQKPPPHTDLERAKAEERAWKQRYLREVQTTFNLQSALAALAEENRCHLEFIAVLEAKVQQLESERAEQFDKSLGELHRSRFENAKMALERCATKPHLQEQTAAAVLRTELNCEKDVNQELRAELQRVAGRYEEIQAALSVSRANQLQATMRLESETSRVKALEDMRLADMYTITRLEGFEK